MDGSLANPNEDGVESFQTMDTLMLDGSSDVRDLEQTALATLVTRILVSRGWRSAEAEGMVQGLGVKELWATLREPQRKAAEPGSGRWRDCSD